jgi:TRAP transporter TAXI family solute receptor
MPAMRTLMIGSIMAVFASMVHAGEMVTLTLGTATPGGGFAVYGQALAEKIKLADAALAIDLRATKGSGENIPLLEAGQLDLALIEGTIAQEVFDLAASKPAKLSVVAAMYPSAGMFVVRGDSPYRRISDLRGRRVVFGASNSGLVVLARYVLDGLGMDMQKDFDGVLLESAKDGPPMVLDGNAAALWGGGLGWPGFVAVAAGPKGARFIGLETQDLARIQAKHPFLKTLTVPAGSYAGLDRDIVTVGAWSMILARPGLSNDIVYRFVRALYSEDRPGGRPPQLRETTAKNTRAALTDMKMLHAGAHRYLAEDDTLEILNDDH